MQNLLNKTFFQKMSKPKRPPVTRYGVVGNNSTRFGNEERFAWQKAKFQSDCVYALPSSMMTRSSRFGGANRKPLNDNENGTTGPGSYNPEKCYDAISDKVYHPAQRFSAAPRESMVMKTPSPGAVYNVGKTYWNGPDKSQPIGFNRDHRKPLHVGENASKDADMFLPKPTYGTARSIAKKLKRKEKGSDTPGAVYDIVRTNRGPEFSFGKGRGDRFYPLGILKAFES